MKKLILIILAAYILIFTSCDLDINDNPNTATSSSITVDLVLPAALATNAGNLTTYHTYGSFLCGYMLPGYGIAGYGDTYTYSFTSSSNTGLWTNVFANLRNYQFIIDDTEEDSQYIMYNSVCKIMKVFNFQLLVDVYGNVPYTEGLSGSENLTPAFDDDADVYKALVEDLDAAIKSIQDNVDNIGAAVTGLTSTSDPMFEGDMTKWIQFANNVKLRLLVRARASSELSSYVSSAFSTFSSEGFLKENATINPGYNTSSVECPLWSSYHSSITGSITTAAKYYIPSEYLFSYYDGGHVLDTIRGKLTYKGFPDTPYGQLGDENNNPASNYYVWDVNDDNASSSARYGVFKDRTQDMPVFLESELYFLLAEAALYGHEVDGDATTNFDKGILASFTFLEENYTGSVIGGTPSSDVATYQSDNSENYLVNIDVATSTEEKLEAIITQKYIALNFLQGWEAWNEYRRTSYPKISGTDASTTFVSVQSALTTSDRLPVRMLYPQTEINLNENTPTYTDPTSNPIFWDDVNN